MTADEAQVIVNELFQELSSHPRIGRLLDEAQDDASAYTGLYLTCVQQVQLAGTGSVGYEARLAKRWAPKVSIAND